MVHQGVMEPAASATLVRQARIAGLCYLLVIAGGLYAEVFVRGLLLVAGDAAATARAIAANQTLWRSGGAVHLLYLGPAIVTNVLICGLFDTGFGFALLFFAGFCVLIGILILRSRLIPRVVGALMILAGSCYVVNTLALLVSPARSDRLVPGILLPVGLAELSLALWLTVKGVQAPKLAAVPGR